MGECGKEHLEDRSVGLRGDVALHSANPMGRGYLHTCTTVRSLEVDINKDVKIFTAPITSLAGIRVDAVWLAVKTNICLYTSAVRPVIVADRRSIGTA